MPRREDDIYKLSNAVRTQEVSWFVDGYTRRAYYQLSETVKEQTGSSCGDVRPGRC